MIRTESEAREFISNLAFDDIALNKLEKLAALLSEENDRQNLVSRSSLDEVWVRHFADSAQLLDHVPRETASSWLDLGSGAGFPGLVVSILRPDQKVVLVESRRKRVEWLEAMASTLGLKNCRVEGLRLELVESFPAGVISARAFAPLPKLLRLSARFSTGGTKWVLPKGRSATQEVEELSPKLKPMFHVQQSMTDTDAGIVVGHGKIGTGK
ncbi:16S rRNA (guanine(527)-N(7))-methyltransferase RsmG [Qipengyuania sp. GH1]|uniref:16S rRNA (guanine(527)-N(7))-methyltransferase RsmG n=1 Tax=Qipengyuania aestuarii TaxID=2867241 RepID=UPI001C88B534|nr:16S rRNA (guanine(527)-N(7))-methyltransferase RsmG [Qipengyuania aestuarii]MBX7536566.1 16S rRNA (guanine(527)-N(7))-methyltransferase RsmG [Qipengyuania aestuarii]